MTELYCVCGNRVYPDTRGYTCNRCFRRYGVKGKLINSFSNSLIQFCDRADKLDDKTMQYHEEEENGKENNDNNGSMEISVRFLSR